MSRNLLTIVAVLFCATSAAAATFVVPTDEAMVAKSDAIALGVVEGHYVQQVDDIETVYEIRIERVFKGLGARDQLIRVVAMGGFIGDEGAFVPGEARYQQGERVLVFLTRDGRGRWRTTDLTLGRFKSVTSTAGERLLVRAMEDVVGWDQAGRPHREKVRKEAGFLRFISERVKGRPAPTDYIVEASAVTLATQATPSDVITNAPFPPNTYVTWPTDPTTGTSRPGRWPSMATTVQVWKRQSQNISGAADGGVSVIQNGLAAWNNECGSVINLNYAGQQELASNANDYISTVEFNDPEGRIGGSWTGEGTIGYTWVRYAGTHTFVNNETWWSAASFDVVFQNGYPATHSAFRTAMTHEIGHGLGWRHSNANHRTTEPPCNPAVEECTSAAIMNSEAVSSYGYTLQPWDVNAAQSVYPGGTCGPTCTAPAITAQPTSRTITSGTSTTLSVTATGTSPLSYQWYIGTSGNTGNPISGATSTSVTVAPTATTSYWVRVTNACGSANSSTATVTVTTPGPSGSLPSGRHFTAGSAGWRSAGLGDFNGDSRLDVVFQNTSTGALQVWFMNGTTLLGSANLLSASDARWRVVAVADFNGDGRGDLLFNHSTTGANVIWIMNNTTFVQQLSLPVSGPDWRIVGAGDFNRDTRVDILFQHRTNGSFVIWYLNGTSFLQQVRLTSTATGAWMALAVTDLNRDGSADIIFRNSSDGRNLVWYMNGVQFSQQLFLPTVSNLSWTITGAGDVSGDGNSDLLWQNGTTRENAFWYMSGTTVL